MNRRSFLKATGLGAASAGLAGCFGGLPLVPLVKKGKQPNILLIMADDMGFSDVGCYGGEIDTPNINKLAENGLRYTQFYNTGRCCPTRASLLTGLYAHRTGMGWMTASDLGHPGYTGDLNDQCVTIAQMLKPAGYRSYISGKWHVTGDRFFEQDSSKHNWPLQRGFDRFYGGLAGGGSYYTPTSLTMDNTRIQPPKNDYYYTDATTAHAVKFLDEHFEAHGEQPFFLYTAYYAPHRPLHAKPEDIAKYRGQYRVGWDKIRSDRYRRLLKQGIIRKNWKLSERDPNVPAWEDVSEEKRDLWDMRMATYAAQVDCMDQGIGKILDRLKQEGALDNTVVFFLSDNGGCAEDAGTGETAIIGTAKSNESYRTAWANASDTPFRRYKSDNHEGGISAPLIIHWPEGLEVQGGSLSHAVSHVIDIMPTCAALAGATYPHRFEGKDIAPLPGKSLLPTFSGEDVAREALFFEHEANRAVRQGKWKLVAKGTRKKPYTGPWELYDLEVDRTELKDLSKQYPDIKNKLAGMWDAWAVENGVYPLDNRGWGVKIKASVS
jgi:arylsulfatase